MKHPAPAALLLAACALAACASTAPSADADGHRTLHVKAGSEAKAANGSEAHPFASVSAAAAQAQPGDTVLVHAGVYRERVTPPRGGSSDALRITYRAAPGEKAVITGSDLFTTWEKVAEKDGQATWKLVIPNARFGAFNPYAEKVWGDWFNGMGRTHHRGMVYLNGEWLPEAANLAAVQGPGAPAWFSVVDGLADDAPTYLMNVVALTPQGGGKVLAASASDRNTPRFAPCSEGGQCVGFIAHGAWIKLSKVDFGAGAESVALRAAAMPGTGGVVEIRDGHFDGELLGTVEVSPTGDWQKWQDFSAKIKRTSGVHDIHLVFKSLAATKAAKAAGKNTGDNTTLYARLPAGTNPNAGAVEVCMRDSVFTPQATGINYLTLAGFDLRNAATNWAAPTMGQQGLVSAYWNKGWIIEDNEISYSRCCGIALGKNSDQWDGQRGTTEGYYDTIKDALTKDGWSKEKIGSHIVRRNHIHHCGQTGVVGSLGCAFSQVIGNDIHDCNMQGIWTGAEMAGIKFHGALDVVIADNHIWRNGSAGGVWLDWMAQGTRITGNLFHDNHDRDLFTEVDHGPFLVANNLFLSPGSYLCNSRGAAFAHNLVAGSLTIWQDGRHTPYMQPHATGQVGLHDCPVGDARWYNNLLTRGANLGGYNQAGKDWECAMAGNVFAKGATPSRFDQEAIQVPAFDPGATLVKKADGWYLTLKTDAAWKDTIKRRLVTTDLLGKAKIPQQGWTLPDGSPMAVDADYFGKPQDKANPFPGPFAAPVDGEVKVWPK